MRITISKTGPPLNHTLWTFIYLCCFIIGFCIQGDGENTRTVNRPERVTYEWPLITNLYRTVHMWRLIYGKPQPHAEKSRQVPDHQQPPSDTPLPARRERQRQLATPARRPAFLLASAFQKAERHGKDARRGHCATAARSPGKGPLHKKADKLLRSGGAVWS